MFTMLNADLFFFSALMHIKRIVFCFRISFGKKVLYAPAISYIIFLRELLHARVSFEGWRSCSVSGRVRSARRHGWAPLFLALPGSGSPRQSTECQLWKLSGDIADWKSVLTVSVAGWVDIATIEIQVVRVSTWVSSTRPQGAVRRLIADAAASDVAANKVAAPSNI